MSEILDERITSLTVSAETHALATFVGEPRKYADYLSGASGKSMPRISISGMREHFTDSDLQQRYVAVADVQRAAKKGEKAAIELTSHVLIQLSTEERLKRVTPVRALAYSIGTHLRDTVLLPERLGKVIHAMEGA